MLRTQSHPAMVASYRPASSHKPNVNSVKQASLSTISGIKPRLDSVSFRGNAKPERNWQQYIGPTLEVLGGAGIAVAGFPLHVIPGLGNAIAFGLHLVGGALALHGLYRAYQRYKGPTQTEESNNNGQYSTQSAKKSGGRPGGSRGSGLLNNVAGGAAAGGAAGAAQAGVEHLFNRDDKEPSKADEHSDAGSDVDDQDDAASVSDGGDDGGDFDFDD